jgi:TP53 regulating kinase-like protein
MKLIQQGAEAKIFLNKNEVTKDREPKTYRHPTLDNQIRTRRTRSEARILTKAKEAKINVPNLIHTEKHILTIEYVDGDRLSQTLNDYTKNKQMTTMQKLGKQVAKLHENNIIHSDLTTSNVILKSGQRSAVSGQRQSKIYLIDFGLSYISTKTENKAVDLHLIKQALEAKHFQNHEYLFQEFLKEYIWKESKAIIERLVVVEKRGRYKH